MTRLTTARLVVAFAGIAVLGYGINADLPNVRLSAMGILLVALLMRFVPPRWFGEDGQT